MLRVQYENVLIVHMLRGELY